jgi:hypothetical protein
MALSRRSARPTNLRCRTPGTASLRRLAPGYTPRLRRSQHRQLMKEGTSTSSVPWMRSMGIFSDPIFSRESKCWLNKNSSGSRRSPPILPLGHIQNGCKRAFDNQTGRVATPCSRLFINLVRRKARVVGQFVFTARRISHFPQKPRNEWLTKDVSSERPREHLLAFTKIKLAFRNAIVADSQSSSNKTVLNFKQERVGLKRAVVRLAN